MIAALIVLAVVGALAWFTYERSQRKTHAVPAGHRPEVTLPHEEEWELYHNALSLCSKKSRLCLAELGVSYKSHPIDLIETGSYENLSRRFLGVNPGGTVPVLVHDGNPIYESHEQIRYAADHAPEDAAPLVPDDPALAAEMQQWIDRSSLYGDDPLAAAHESAGNTVPGLTAPLFAAMIEEIPRMRILEGLLFHRYRQRPLLFLGMKQVGIAKLHKGPAAKIIGRCLGHMHEHLDALEEQLAKTGGPWILGDAFSLADVSWAVVLERLREADSLHVFIGPDSRPHVTAYWQRWRARPSYQAAITDHGHPIMERGLERIRRAKQADPALRATLEEIPTR